MDHAGGHVGTAASGGHSVVLQAREKVDVERPDPRAQVGIRDTSEA